MSVSIGLETVITGIRRTLKLKARVKTDLIAKIDKLIAEAKDMIASPTQRDYSHPGSSEVQGPRLRKWSISCRNLVVQIGHPARVWEDVFPVTHNWSNVGTVEGLLAYLESLRDAIDSDLLLSLEDLIASEAFGGLLEQAEELFSKGYLLAAGVLGRAVLEEHLRKLCERLDCIPDGRPTINDLNMTLYKNGHLDKLAMQGVTGMATAGNHCAHNNEPPLSGPDVKKFLGDVRDFLVRTPLN